MTFNINQKFESIKILMCVNAYYNVLHLML